ncbi:MAG: GIY-YIG nuclease family protein [Proteobacteria bacterium]|nr:GIY-YIG nuclease family protein [Pseudomonadota bacterium]
MAYYVYLMASKRNGTLYVGVTNDLVRRAYEHREGQADGFTKKYAVKNLVYFEVFEEVREAIQRERNLKHWRRAWKIDLIERGNPQWNDLYDTITQ